MSTAVDTKRVTGRRTLRFASVAEMRREVERIAAADRNGTLKRLGNWTAGQTFGHLATWINFAYEGYPPQLRPPLPLKLLMRLMRRRFLSRPLPVGFRIPKLEGGTVGTEPLPLQEGLDRLLSALDRLDREAPTLPNPIFGPMSHEDWKQGHLRHGELHLSFLDPGQ